MYLHGFIKQASINDYRIYCLNAQFEALRVYIYKIDKLYRGTAYVPKVNSIPSQIKATSCAELPLRTNPI